MNTVTDELRGRLAQLQREYQVGEGRLQELLRQESALRETLLRISGAVQVLEEVLASTVDADPGSGRGGGTPDGAPATDGRAPADVLTVP